MSCWRSSPKRSFGVLAAALINQVKFGRQWLLAAVILPWALPGVVNAVIWLWIYQPGAGLLNGHPDRVAGLPFENHVWFNDRTSAIIAVTVVHVWRMMPLTVVIVLAAMQSIPDHLYEAARIDGATRPQMFLLDHAAAGPQRHRRGDDQRDGGSPSTCSTRPGSSPASSLETRPVLVQIYLETFQNLHFSYGMALSLVITWSSLARLAGLRPPRLSQHTVRLMKQSLGYRIVVWVGVALLLIWSLGPIYWTLASSVTPANDFSARPIHFFSAALHARPLRAAARHQCRPHRRRRGLGAVPRGAGQQHHRLCWRRRLLCVAIAALRRLRVHAAEFPGSPRRCSIAVVATLAIPGYAVLIPLYRLMIGLHLVDTYVGVTLIYVSAYLPLSLWLMRSVFESLPIALEEAAQLDGAGRLYIFFRIVLPLVGPGPDGGGDPHLPRRLGAVPRAADLLADGDQAADRPDPRVRHQELHRLRPDHGGRVDRHHHPGPGRHLPQPLPGQRPARRIGQMTADNKWRLQWE